jgi:hypothetical protein
MKADLINKDGLLKALLAIKNDVYQPSLSLMSMSDIEQLRQVESLDDELPIEGQGSIQSLSMKLNIASQEQSETDVADLFTTQAFKKEAAFETIEAEPDAQKESVALLSEEDLLHVDKIVDEAEKEQAQENPAIIENTSNQSVSDRNLNHPIYQHIKFLTALNQDDKKTISEMLLDGYKGFNPGRIIDYQAGFSPTQTQLNLLLKDGVSLDDITEYQKLISLYYANENEALKDSFELLPPPILDKWQSELHQMPAGSEILINEIGDPIALMHLLVVEEYANKLNITIKPQTKAMEFVLRSLFENEYPVTIVTPDFKPQKGQFDLAIGRVSIDGEMISSDKEDYSYELLRMDEKEVLSILNSAPKVMLSIPSVLLTEKRGLFHDALNDSPVDGVVRLPINNHEQSFDLLMRLSDEPKTYINAQSVVDFNGEPLHSTKTQKAIQTYYSKNDMGAVISHSVEALKGEMVDFPKLSTVKTNNSKIEEKAWQEPSHVEGCFYLDENGSAYQFSSGKKIALKGIKLERATHFIRVKDALERAFEAQKQGNKTLIEKAMKELNSEYNAFVERLGFINERKNELLLASDYRFNNVSMLEKSTKDKETGETYYEPSRWLIDEQFKPEMDDKNVHLDIQILKEFEKTGAFDLSALSQKTDMTEDEVLEYIVENQIGYQVGKELVHRDVYLSGNVSEKLIQAKKLAETSPSYQRNIKALEEVMPKPIHFEDIYFTIGSHWMNPSVINDFILEMTGETINVKTDPISLSWAVIDSDQAKLRKNASFNAAYGAGFKQGIDVLMAALNQESTVITRGGTVDVEASEIYRSKVEDIQEAFRQYVSRKPEYKEWVSTTYNHLFNGYRKAQFHSVNSSMPGMSSTINLRKHQIDSIHSAVQFGSFLYAHDAGSGKTFTQVGAAMLHARRNGKPSLIAVPNHMPRQMMREAISLFPEAKVLYLDNDILKKPDDLLKLINSVKFDLLIIKHDSLNRYLSAPIAHEQKALVHERFKILSLMDYFTGNKAVQGELAKGLGNIDKRLNKLKENDKISIDRLNIGALIVDEAHNFKNLEIINPTGNMVDSINGSDRALALKMMIDYIYSTNNSDSKVVFATGTPVSNSLLEIFNLQNYLQPRLMKKLGLHNIKNWMDTFLEVKTQYEPDVTGQKFIPKSRYVLKNIPELISILSNSMNVVTLEDAGIQVPESKMHYESCALDGTQTEILEQLVERLDAVKEKRVSNDIDNMLKIISDSRKMALSPGLIADALGNKAPTMSPKIERLCENVFDEYQKSHDILGAQLVFCDLGTPSGFPDGNSVYDLIKARLVEKGMLPDEIAFIHDPKNEKEKELLFSSVREGSVRVLIGSTAKMGEGTNVQERLVASHDLDPPWRPKDIIQRRRRTVRQGNINEEVSLYVYMTDNSFDAYAWSKLDAKNKAFSYIMSGKAVTRSFELELDPSFSEAYAIVTGREELIEAAKLESELITLNANKKGLERQKEAVKTQIDLNTIAIKQSQNEIEQAGLLNKIGNKPSWSINGMPATRTDVLKKRSESIAYSGFEVAQKDDKKWRIGGFEFKRPSDIEKDEVIHFIIEKGVAHFVEARKSSIAKLEAENTMLNATLNAIDVNKFDNEIEAKSRRLDGLMDELAQESNKDMRH